jgi:hypothetical protein
MYRALVCAIVVAAVVAGCAPPVSRPAGSGREMPPGFPDGYYQSAATRGEPVFAIEKDRSLVVIEVRRAGALARLGHDHVVASHDVQGFVAPASHRADLFVPLERLAVDEQDLRTQAGFGARPPEEAVEGTRRNMLGPVLHADEHPFATISISQTEAHGELDVAITLNGIEHASQVRASIETQDDEFAVSGRLSLDQSDFGIAPLSILGGAIQVQDRVAIRFTIRARRINRR